MTDLATKDERSNALDALLDEMADRLMDRIEGRLGSRCAPACWCERCTYSAGNNPGGLKGRAWREALQRWGIAYTKVGRRLLARRSDLDRLLAAQAAPHRALVAKTATPIAANDDAELTALGLRRAGAR